MNLLLMQYATAINAAQELNLMGVISACTGAIVGTIALLTIPGSPLYIAMTIFSFLFIGIGVWAHSLAKTAREEAYFLATDIEIAEKKEVKV